MKVVFILGNAAVGKMTVGQELQKLTDFRLMHNHITIEPVLEVFGYYDNRLVSSLRFTMLEALSKTQFDGVIITLMLNFDSPSDWSYLEKLMSFFDESTEFYYVELCASLETRLYRNRTSNRLEHKPSKRDIKSSEMRIKTDDSFGRYETYKDEFPYNNFIKIQNDNLSAKEVALIIQNRFKLKED